MSLFTDKIPTVLHVGKIVVIHNIKLDTFEGKPQMKWDAVYSGIHDHRGYPLLSGWVPDMESYEPFEKIDSFAHIENKMQVCDDKKYIFFIFIHFVISGF